MSRIIPYIVIIAFSLALLWVVSEVAQSQITQHLERMNDFRAPNISAPEFYDI